MLSFFKQRRDRGVTVLVPDAKRVKKLFDLHNSGDTVKYAAAVQSLIIPYKVDKLSDLSDGFTTGNSEKIVVDKATESSVDLACGCKITPLKDQTISRSYFNGFMLSGIGELTGEKVASVPAAAAPSKARGKVSGGMMVLSEAKSCRRLVNIKVESIYMHPTAEYIGKSIYFKKVILQWSILERHCPEKFQNGEILNYMGNEEVSDSYLLDMITPDECFRELYQCLGGEGPCPVRLQSLGFKEYIDKRNAVIRSASGGWAGASTAATQEELLKRITSPIEARNEIRAAYGENMHRLGRDLFVIFTNISKEMWLNARAKSLAMNGNDYTHLDNASFKAYINCVHSLYGVDDITEITRTPFKKEQDFKFYVNLIKSDVFLLVPVEIGLPYNPPSGFVVPNGDHPPEFDKKLYSMNALMVLYSSTGGLVRGGSDDADALLDKYL